MKIINHTHFQTRDLKKIITTAVRNDEKIEGLTFCGERRGICEKGSAPGIT